MSDTGIVKIRRLLLKVVKDLAAGETPPGMNAASYRVRSSRFRLPESMQFSDALDEHIRIDETRKG
ncbi:MAG: hypothetical protein Q7R45_15905, partial [Sulfuricaulis sp.]|nr:hypothetical protein [Sulfuricaulis sp.]